MAQLTDIPNEILFLFISYLPLKALISARGVNQHWRQLVFHANILPARRELLDLYLTIIASPLFIRTRPWVLSRLKPFDRKGYLDAVLEYPHFPQESKKRLHLPEEFRLWVLEWPARAAIRCSWPGLPYRGRYKYSDDSSEVTRKLNFLERNHLRFWAINLHVLPDLCYENMPLLSVGGARRLSLDNRDGVRGKTYELSYLNGSYEASRVYANFIDWQRRLWEMEEEEDAERGSQRNE